MELMEEAVQTRTANGMKTILRDVWDGLDDGAEMLLPEYNLLIASPPCQTFSMAGSGSGRKALDEVIEAIQLEAYKRPADLKAFGDKHDDRTALVLTPLAYVYRDRPKYVAMEQVPTVLPVWEACAKVMRGWGYEVKTAVLHAEQYGVPQTRKRAILVAKLDAYVDLPTPTHSKYYPTNPTKLDPGVQKWVSMAEALGWADTPQALRSNYGTGGDPANRGERTTDQPAPTVTSKADRNKWDGDGSMTAEEAAALQTYPSGVYVHPMTNGRRAIWPSDEPSPTIRGVNRPMPASYEPHERDACAPEDAHPRVSTEEAATLQTYPTGWGFTDRPAVTLANGAARGLGGGSGAQNTVKQAIADGTFIPSPHGDGSSYPQQTRITSADAGVLQTYDRPFIWKGTKTKIFLQIGNAVPPLLAQHVLTVLLDDSMDLL